MTRTTLLAPCKHYLQLHHKFDAACFALYCLQYSKTLVERVRTR